MESDRYTHLLSTLENTYPDARPELYFTNPFETLIATILSAQCTDRQVNKVTPVLFAKYPDPASLAAIEPEELEPLIKSCGFYHSKAHNIVMTCRELVSRYDGVVPNDMEALQALPGVGRKTANVVLANAFHVDAIAVDTHVFRVSNRLGLAMASNVKDTEMQLRQNIPQNQWSRAHHWLIHHGRRICQARQPQCIHCTLAEQCAWYQATQPNRDDEG